ncbi:MAG: hypothetical protein V4525_04765 [Pseudomonadota bacterium]
MHQGLSYTVLERLSEKLKRIEDTDQNPYHVCWEQSSALCSALEQDLRYMGGSQGWPCIIELSFSLKDTEGSDRDCFRALVKYPGRFQDDIRVVVTGLIHVGRIDLKVRNVTSLQSNKELHGKPYIEDENQEAPLLLADKKGNFWVSEGVKA